MEITIKTDLKTGESSVEIKSNTPIDKEDTANIMLQAAKILLKS